MNIANIPSATQQSKLFWESILYEATPRLSHVPLLEIQTKAIRKLLITEKAPSRAFSWLKAATTAFTFKTLLRHYAKQALTPRSLNVKLGPRRKGHKGRAVWLA